VILFISLAVAFIFMLSVFGLIFAIFDAKHFAMACATAVAFLMVAVLGVAVIRMVNP
jgi:hypothetical protein